MTKHVILMLFYVVYLVSPVVVALLPGQCIKSYEVPGLSPATQYKCEAACDKGYHIKTHCTQSNPYNTECVICKRNTFSIKCNEATACHPCTASCTGTVNTTIIKNCTRFEDIVCGCQKGYYMHDGFYCLIHKVCPLGQGVNIAGNTTHNTECGPCSIDTFSNVRSSTAECQNCSNCSQSAIITPCNITHDAVCEPVTTVPTSVQPEPPSVQPRTSFEIATIVLGVLIAIAVLIICILILYIIRCTVRKEKKYKVLSKSECKEFFQSDTKWSLNQGKSWDTIICDIVVPGVGSRYKEFLRRLDFNGDQIHVFEQETQDPRLNQKETLYKGIRAFESKNENDSTFYKRIGEALYEVNAACFADYKDSFNVEPELETRDNYNVESISMLNLFT